MSNVLLKLLRAGGDALRDPSGCTEAFAVSIKTQSFRARETAFAYVERAMGVEPTSVAWEATVLPMNYARIEMNFSTEPRNPSVH